MRRRAPYASGFTLIELGIVIGLLGIIMAIAIPSVNALTGAELRSNTAQIAGTIREGYARAAITGKTHRLVFDLDSGLFWLERTDERFVLPSERIQADSHGRGGSTLEERQEAAKEGVKNRVQTLTGGSDVGSDALAALGLGGAGGTGGMGAMGGLFNNLSSNSMSAGFGVDEDLEEALKNKLRRQVSFLPVEGDIGRPQKLGEEIRFHRIWTGHQREGFTSGSAELYFFPTGFTERAHITLTDDEYGESSLTVVVNPLTARTKVLDEQPEDPR